MVLVFTIEQVDLVRRLRDTGIKLKEIAIIFVRLEKLDKILKKGPDSGLKERPAPLDNVNSDSASSALAAEAVVVAEDLPEDLHEDLPDEEDSSSESSDSSSPPLPEPANPSTTTFLACSRAAITNAAAPAGGDVHCEGTCPDWKRRLYRFKESQLFVLKCAFARKPYPDAEDCAAIANECNAVDGKWQSRKVDDKSRKSIATARLSSWFVRGYLMPQRS